MKSNITSILIIFSFLTSFYSVSQEMDLGPIALDIQPQEVIKFSADTALIYSDGKIEVGVRLQTEQDFTIYKENLKIETPLGYPLIKSTFPDAFEQYDPISRKDVEVYKGGEFILFFEGPKTLDQKIFPLHITFVGCTKKICLFPYTEKLDIPIYMAQPKDVNEAALGLTKESQNTAQLKSSEEKLGFEEQFVKDVQSGNITGWFLIVVLFVAGIATNLTPCVFPMVPITLRILGGKHHSKMNPFLYCLGIIGTYTSMGVIAALTGGMFGSAMANAYVNYFFAIVFILLGMTMLGFGNLAFLQNVGSKMGAKSKGPASYLAMGAGAGLIAAPCTGPILGALLAFTAKNNDPIQTIYLFLTYSIGFALPYLILGIFATNASKFKVSYKVQVATKYIFASIMFGLALFYLKNPLHNYLDLFTGYWQFSATVLSVAGICLAFSFVQFLKLENNKKAMLIPTIILGIGIFSSSQWLSGGDKVAKLQWIKNEAQALQLAKETNKPILVDGWAEWCAACIVMDNTTYRDPAVVKELKNNWVILKIDFTDIDAGDNPRLSEKYVSSGLPVTVLLPSNGDTKKWNNMTSAMEAKTLIRELKKFKKETH